MINEVIKVPNKKTLEMLQNCVEDEVAYVEDMNMHFIFNDGEWIPYYVEKDNPLEKGSNEMDLYAMNKILISQIPDYTPSQIEDSKKIIRKFIDENDNNVYMLLCNELRYYTVFILDKDSSDEKIEDVVIECLSCMGAIKSIEVNEETEAIELWFNYEDEPHAAFLFGYDEGVVVCQ